MFKKLIGRRKPAPERIAKARELAAAGKNATQVAKEMGVSRTTAASWLKVKEPKPEPEPVRLFLVECDPRATGHQRRADCARLWTCESNWIEVHGSAHATCPSDCEGFLKLDVMVD